MLTPAYGRLLRQSQPKSVETTAGLVTLMEMPVSCTKADRFRYCTSGKAYSQSDDILFFKPGDLKHVWSANTLS